MDMQFLGTEKLTKDEKEQMKTLTDEYTTKIQRHLKNIDSMILHVKEYNRGGAHDRRVKFSLHIRAIAPTHIFEADATEWELQKVIHKVFEKLEQEIEHRFHTSDQHKR